MMTAKQRFDEVVLPNLASALSLARWLTGNPADAEDVVQDACLRAFAAIRSANGPNPRAWLLTIVRHAAYTWLARNRSRQLVVTDDEAVFEKAGLDLPGRPDLLSADAALIAQADAAMLHRAIAALPLPYREIVVLREFEELSYREIAEVLKIPLGTVMSRLARARAALMALVLAEQAGKAGAA
jgi:RNA polymerase sigma-70 factor (ECF subfamily)